ncbi:excinuclease ABC subunit UvrC [Chloroflexota bacterium]
MIGGLIAEQLRQVPESPGVYLFKDAQGNIIYVGKAASLHHRVRSYFGVSTTLSPKLTRLVARTSNLDFLVTRSEQEALILECNLIKHYRPHYNVRLKDDKAFPYLRINLGEDWPRICVTRRLEEDGAKYFGPFASAKSVKQTLKVLKGIFPFRSCSRTITGSDPRPCLDYYIHQCLGPCVGSTSKQEYAEIIKQVILFLDGKQEKVVLGLESQMRKVSEALDFERAALLRDQLKAINRVIEGQRIAATVRGEQDVIAFAQDKYQACVQVFFIRNSKLIGRESFVLRGTGSEEPRQIMTDFVKQFYSSSSYIPPLLLLQYPVEDVVLVKNWLQSKRGGKVDIQVPRQGNRKNLVNTVAQNAEQGLQQLTNRGQSTPSLITQALAEIQRDLCLSRLPLRMECYDISNIQGRAAVGSMVVFDKGKPVPSHYRRFRIKTVCGANDYAMLKEVLKRRFERASLQNSEAAALHSWTILPDLIIVDGGKGQLNAALEVMQAVGAEAVPVASLAKENEEIFLPAKNEAVILLRNSPGLQLLQRLRDEAHRFALGYHRKVRYRESFTSFLDSIPGIGPRRKRVLLRKFGSVQGIREASEGELAEPDGMTRKLAKKIKECL